MDYARIKEIAKNHHLEMSYPLYDAMKQAAGEAAQEMRCRYLDVLHELQLPDEMITDINRQASRRLSYATPTLNHECMSRRDFLLATYGETGEKDGPRQNTCDNLHDSDLWPDRMA